MIASDPLKKNLDWYVEHQVDLAAKFNGKVLLIVNQELIGAFDSMEAAYTNAIKKYEIGNFTLQPCSPSADSYTLTLYNPRFSVSA